MEGGRSTRDPAYQTPFNEAAATAATAACMGGGEEEESLDRTNERTKGAPFLPTHSLLDDVARCQRSRQLAWLLACLGTFSSSSSSFMMMAWPPLTHASHRSAAAPPPPSFFPPTLNLLWRPSCLLLP